MSACGTDNKEILCGILLVGLMVLLLCYYRKSPKQQVRAQDQNSLANGVQDRR